MSAPLLLAEELFLLAHDDESGKSDNTMGLTNGLAGALLLDLAADERVTASGKDLSAVGSAPAHPLLAAAHAEIVASAKSRAASHWVGRLPAALKPLDQQVGRSLAERGVLSEQHKKQAEARAKEIADAGAVGSAVSAAFSQSVQAVQLAVVTAVIVPTVVASS